jgi:two-component system nitrate/nitrite response regulator NarL
MNKPVTIYLADDHKIILDGLKRLIGDETSMMVIGTANDSDTAYKEIVTKKPDLALLDLRMPPGMSGLELMQQLKRVLKDTKFIILSMHDDKQYITDAKNGGAAGYLLKNADKAELMNCLKTVLDGGTSFPKLPAAINDSSKPLFTHKETEIVKLIEDGYTTAEIAEKLCSSPRTIETHRKNICRKTNTSTPLGLSKFLRENNIVL